MNRRSTYDSMPQLVSNNGYISVVVHRPDLADRNDKLAPFLEKNRNAKDMDDKKCCRKPCCWTFFAVILVSLILGLLCTAVYLLFGRKIENLFNGRSSNCNESLSDDCFLSSSTSSTGVLTTTTTLAEMLRLVAEVTPNIESNDVMAIPHTFQYLA